jgi:site-specific DNA recombinase
MRAALSARVSTQEQAEKIAPIADQLACGRAFCASHEWPVALEEVDEGISGSVWPRPGLMSLLEAARRGEFEILVVWAYSRVGRDENLELFGHIMWEFRQAGVRVVSVTEEGASPIETNVQGMMAGIALQKLKDDVNRGMRQKAGRREYTGGRALFGYNWTSRTERVVVPEEAAIVARVYEMADPAGECRQLATIARELGLELQRVRRMLRHPGYAGAYTYSRFTFAGAGSRKKMARPAPLDRQIITWGAHEEIVPRDLWDRVQQRLDEQAERRPNNNGQASLPLTGLVRCGVCSRPLRVTGFHRPPGDVPVRYYYRCDTDGCPGIGNACVAGWTTDVVRAVMEQLRRPDIADAIVAEIRRAYDDGRRSGAWEAEVRRLEKAEASIRAVISSGEISDTRALARDYEATRRGLERARASLERDRRKAGLRISPASIRARLARACALLGALEDRTEADKAVRPLLAHFVESITVEPGAERATVQLRSDVVDVPPQPYLSGGREIRPLSFPMVLPPRALSRRRG